MINNKSRTGSGLLPRRRTRMQPLKLPQDRMGPLHGGTGQRHRRKTKMYKHHHSHHDSNHTLASNHHSNTDRASHRVHTRSCLDRQDKYKVRWTYGRSTVEHYRGTGSVSASLLYTSQRYPSGPFLEPACFSWRSSYYPPHRCCTAATTSCFTAASIMRVTCGVTSRITCAIRCTPGRAGMCQPGDDGVITLNVA